MIAGVVLAAGASTRARFAKALATLDGQPLVARIARTLRAAGCEHVVVVVGPPHAARVRAAVRDVTFVDNPAPERGMLSSLQVALAALAHAPAGDVEAAVVALVDHPRVQVATVSSLIAAWRTEHAAVVRPSLDGRRGHPYVVDRSLFGALAHASSDDGGARPVLRAASPAVDLPVDDAAILDDLDTPEGLARAGVLPPAADAPRNG